MTRKDQQKCLKGFTGGGQSELSYSGFGIGLFIQTRSYKDMGVSNGRSEKEKGATFLFSSAATAQI